jgi:hypothetical protein
MLSFDKKSLFAFRPTSALSERLPAHRFRSKGTRKRKALLNGQSRDGFEPLRSLGICAAA